MSVQEIISKLDIIYTETLNFSYCQLKNLESKHAGTEIISSLHAIELIAYIEDEFQIIFDDANINPEFMQNSDELLKYLQAKIFMKEHTKDEL